MNDPGFVGKTVEELLLLVGDGDKGQRRAALGRLRDLGLGACAEVLEGAVRNDDNADLRNGAMDAFVEFGREAVPMLLELLGDGNEEVRNFCTVMLGNIGCRQAVGPLIQALGDPDANVRHGAAEALGKIGDRRAVQPLREMERGDFWDSFYARAALGSLADGQCTGR